MSLQLAAILDVPWNAAVSALHNWQTVVAGVWGAGVLVLAYRSMIRWYREDAEDARRLAPKGDADAIYVAMKEVKKGKREPRLKHFFTQVLFWLPIAGYRAGKKIAYFVSYPVLMLADKAKSEAVDAALKPGKDHVHRCSCGINLVPASKSGHTHEVEVTVNAKCKSCNEVFIADTVHACKKATPSCGECGKKMIADKVHVCSEAAEAESEENHQDCQHCGDCIEADKVHVCSALEAQEEGDDVEAEYCSDCDKEYDRGEKHVSKHCLECREDHCTRSACA
jgi:transposase-like protein